ncbi:uncharacterized GPI-anchored protein At5g19250-like [Euphorbia lathyris]|uniref:uncharacterized GPI-anchored protein At5g19250-like n=1 Tax=Euphorbia lathyris TaxID=212925 RepID=UPI003313DC98
MASLKSQLFLVLLVATFLLASPVYSDDEEEDLLKTLNTHRAYMGLPILSENEEASCVADRIAQTLKKHTCENNFKPFQLNEDTHHILSKCEINVNHTKHSVVLPVCVPDLDVIEVFTNYTKTNFAKYLNNSGYAQAGISSDGDWMVVVLGTNTVDGDFASSGASSLVSFIGFFGTLILGSVWFNLIC